MPKDIFTAEWFPYYFERFEGSARVAAMSLAEDGGYHKAIRIAWKYGSVPSDPKLLAAMIQKKCTEKMAAKILTMFEPMPGVPSRSIHPTVEEIRADQERKYLNRVKGGKASAVSRGNKDTSSITEEHSNSKRDLDSERERDLERDLFPETDSCVPACVRDGVRQSVAAYPDVDPKLVEIAVIKTLITHRNSPNAKPIKNLARYCREEIEDMVLNAKKLGSKAINAMLFSHRKKAEKYLAAAEEVFTAKYANGREYF